MRLIDGMLRQPLSGYIPAAYALLRIALAPPFPGLRRFKQGRNFQQWTGNDSKALMKVCFLLITTIACSSRDLIPGVGAST
jgi:hypothetical protein